MPYTVGLMREENMDKKICTRLQLAKRRKGKIYDVKKNVRGKNVTF